MTTAYLLAAIAIERDPNEIWEYHKSGNDA